MSLEDYNEKSSYAGLRVILAYCAAVISVAIYLICSNL